MSTSSLTTAAEILALPTGMGQRYELVLGELRVMSPSGWRHGSVVSNLHIKLASFIEQHQLGMTFGAETGFQLTRDPDTVRAPDFAFIATGNLPESMPSEAFWPGAPDLAVEVLSPDDRLSEVNEKIASWLAAGTSAVWIIDPKLRTVTVHQRGATSKVYSHNESFVGDPVVPGFSCPVAQIFR